MNTRVSSFLRRAVALWKKRGNLISCENPFSVLRGLLDGHAVSDVVDAGASNGQISRKLLARFPKARVHGFEPNPDYRAALTAFAKEEPRFRPEFCALSDSDEDVELQCFASPGINSIYTPNRRLRAYSPAGTESRTTVRVPCTTLDQWRATRQVPGVQVIKLDIQGAEGRALRGASGLLREAVLAVYTELLFNPLYEQGAIYSEIDLFLRQHGFALYSFYGPKTDARGLLLWGNAIYIQPEKLGL
ncbi:MAG TPA: FkbM family methyltransferase [Verrucomicrobiota bacterium]|nr:FkbM family methyltransferase [Verrucomicrobiota bacterium]